ncbi:MAG TPA: Na(+)/H(+) antiporter subunit C [Actinomyces sp.]|jgi:multicomponent Na+:H+ antiporter subunit C|nr:Na(+)/H(+) antiporter subunit C [Actinomyces sp.]
MTTPSLAVIILAGVLVATGAYLVMERTLTRIIIGLALMGHGVNVLILAAGGGAGRPALLDGTDPSTMSDPLPQAMMLTAIVIGLGTTAFGMALAYRSWSLTGHDEVVDDVEDRRLARRAAKARLDERLTEQVTGAEDPGIDYDALSVEDEEDQP